LEQVKQLLGEEFEWFLILQSVTSFTLANWVDGWSSAYDNIQTPDKITLTIMQFA